MSWILRRSRSSATTSTNAATLTNQVNSAPMQLPSLIIPKTEPEACPQLSMKMKILEIQKNQALTPKEKAVGMQKLMMQRWNSSQGITDDEGTETESAMESDSDQQIVTTYHDEARGVLGCQHYKRNCKLLAKCCNKWYTCRFCHDEAENHAFDRYATEEISCLKCNTRQALSEECVACKTSFAKYYCQTCKFYDNEEEKDIYHCDKCNICRIGKGLGIDYFHCDRCNACMSVTLKDHKCVERSLESDCPICHTYMFTSTTPVMFLGCGHCMHVSCYEEYTLTNYVCPLCSKSLGDMAQYFERIDQVLATEQMPDEYKDHRSNIFCSDCERKSTTTFHFIYHKCQYQDCGSYNTKVLSQFQLQPGQEEVSIDPNTPRAPPIDNSSMVEYH